MPRRIELHACSQERILGSTVQRSLQNTGKSQPSWLALRPLLLLEQLNLLIPVGSWTKSRRLKDVSY
jgi:hypothetical protein